MEKIVVLGAGESGVGSAILAKKQNIEVFLSDMGEIAPKYIELLDEWKIDYEQKAHTMDKITDATLCIKSPGIPDNIAIVQKIKDKNIPIISEIEFAGRFCDAKCICVTGSNGKTTTTTIIHQILTDAGYNVGVAGNIGSSFAYQVATTSRDWYVLELSSFQLDGMTNFKADYAVITNITPDHLDRYNYDFTLYRDSKFRITQNMSIENTLLYCMDDHTTLNYMLDHKESFMMNTIPFTTNETVLNGIYLNSDDNTIVFNFGERVAIIERSKLQILGLHNVYNIMAAAGVALSMGIDSEAVTESIYAFKGVEHRMEVICERDNVLFINDSKATNVDSAFYALKAIDRPIVWIAGGVDKGNDYSSIYPITEGKVTTLICMGTNNDKLIESFTTIIPFIYSTSSLEETIKCIRTVYKRGDCVLLSPMCASFDLFKSYEDRGDQFKEAILNMPAKTRE